MNNSILNTWVMSIPLRTCHFTNDQNLADGDADVINIICERFFTIKYDNPGASHIFRIVWIIIPACLIKQPNGTLSRLYVQTYISVK